MLRRLHTVLCVAVAGLLLQVSVTVASAVAAVGQAAAQGLDGARASEAAAMRQGTLLMSLRSDDDETGVLSMLMEQVSTIELVLSAHFGSEDVRVVDITPAVPEDLGRPTSPPEVQHARLTFELAPPETPSAGEEDTTMLQVSLQQSLDEADAQLAIEELLVSWDKATTSGLQAMARASETPSTTLYV